MKAEIFLSSSVLFVYYSTAQLSFLLVRKKSERHKRDTELLFAYLSSRCQRVGTRLGRSWEIKITWVSHMGGRFPIT